jgi:ABC-type multidrug transport system ATPase subunit
MIVATNITKRYGKMLALDNVSFTIEAGDSIALWGANGAGKTTAIRCLLGIHSFEGALTINGIDVLKQGKAARALIGYVPQEMTFFEMSVAETMLFYARLKKVDTQTIDSVLKTVDLFEHRTKSVNALSGGMKQRLALAVALLANPPILLLDEPTASLDAAAQRDFIHMIRDLNKAGKTVIFSSHRFEEVAALSKRVLLLNAGRLVNTFTPQDLAVELGLRQWLRLIVSQDDKSAACAVLENEGYQFVPNGKAIYVNISTRQKLDVLRLFTTVAIPIADFDVTDSYAVPDNRGQS